MEKSGYLEKYKELLVNIKSLGKVAVAYSGGVDSTLLLYAAKEALGDNVIALTARSVFIPEREYSEASEYCKELGISHRVVSIDVLSDEKISDNPPDRCYICKKKIFSCFVMEAKKLGIDYVLEGSNLDDEGDYRPGAKAIKELGILSPLKEASLYKEDIRKISRELGIYTWNKPSYACLASRIPYNEKITEEKLKMVEAAEEYLIQAGFVGMRVRAHGSIARIELRKEDFPRFLDEDVRKQVSDKLREIGFSYVTLDLMGYRVGSLNETLTSIVK